jgi:hypothetical protein
MTFDINAIKSALADGGARPSLFNVQLALPTDLDIENRQVAQDKFTFLCRAASLPAETISEIPVPYMGRQIYVSGNRVFEPWTITVINDEDFLIRGVFEAWMDAINKRGDNIRADGATSSPNSYKGELIVRQFRKDDDETPARKYLFQGAFPTEVSAIELDWGTESAIEEFTVTLRYDRWDVDNTPE